MSAEGKKILFAVKTRALTNWYKWIFFKLSFHLSDECFLLGSFHVRRQLYPIEFDIVVWFLFRHDFYYLVLDPKMFVSWSLLRRTKWKIFSRLFLKTVSSVTTNEVWNVKWLSASFPLGLLPWCRSSIFENKNPANFQQNTSKCNCTEQIKRMTKFWEIIQSKFCIYLNESFFSWNQHILLACL